MKVLAALDNSLAARPVLDAASSLGRALDANVEAVHVTTNGHRVAAGAAAAADVPLTTLSGAVVARLLDAARAPDAAAIVIGTRGTRASRRPLGGTALSIATALDKPVVVVPPGATIRPLHRVLVPIENGFWSAMTPRAIVEFARTTKLDVVVLHVLEDELIPAFTDQPQHERHAWAREFLRRYCPWGIETLTLETRVGRSEELVPQFAVETAADMIGLAWSQELAAGRAPVVRAALTRAHVPVMLVPVRVDAGAEIPRTHSVIARMPAPR
jgi:nucleotide-binding universal stress UspA family protein